MAEDATTPSAPAPNVDPIAEIAELLTEQPVMEDNQPPAAPDTTDQDDLEPEEDDESDQHGQEPSSEEDDTAEDDEQDSRSLSELIGLDSDQVSVNEETGDLLIGTNVDGVKTQLSFKEVLAGYQTQKSNTQRSQALAKERKEFEEAAQGKIQQVQQGLQYNEALTKQLHSELLKEYQNTDWDTLRTQDPAEYAARQQDQQVRYNQIQGLQKQLGEQQQIASQQLNEEQTAQRNHYLEQQRDIMLDQIPEWRDPDKMKTEMSEVRAFLNDTYGFGDDDIAMVVEARQVQLIRDAMAFRKGKTVAEKKVAKNVPKMQKAKGAKRRVKATKLDRLTKAAQSAKGADRRSLELDAVAELLS